jgi:hypothetical protein
MYFIVLGKGAFGIGINRATRPPTTKLYDRTKERLTQDEVERTGLPLFRARLPGNSGVADFGKGVVFPAPCPARGFCTWGASEPA